MNSSTPACVEAAGFAGLRNLNFHGDCRSNDVRCAKADGGMITGVGGGGATDEYKTRRAVLRAGHTFSTITDVLSFLPGEHSHAVCFEILVELPWISMVGYHSTGNIGSSSKMLLRDCATKCHHILCQLGK